MNRDCHSCSSAARTPFAGLDLAQLSAPAIANFPAAALASFPLSSKVTAKPISFLKREFATLMVEMGYLYPECRFVWR